ncbi:MAG: 30S ribosomal protein S9 [Candidatus Bathyarchaeota archaeon]
MPVRKQPRIAIGKRKTAIAKAIIRPGFGNVRVNKTPVELLNPEVARLKVLEPLMLVEDFRKQLDIDVNVKGGGFMSQAEAARMSIARGIYNWFKNAKIKRILTEYDRSMLAGDSRRKEVKQFGGIGARRRRQKSYR